mgnify:CR=1 FL=1
MSNLTANNNGQQQLSSSMIVTRQIHNRNHHHHHRNHNYRSHHHHHHHNHHQHHQNHHHQQQQQNKTISNKTNDTGKMNDDQKLLSIQQNDGGDNGNGNDMKKIESKIRLNYIIPVNDGEHLLRHSWTFWYLKFGPNFDWEHSQIDVATFSTVESFWGVFDRVLPLTDTHHGCNYSLFKYGIRPIWEDPRNRNGGRFVFTINKDGEYKQYAMEMWTEFCMLIIGNQYEMICERICGIVGGNRNTQIKIAIWIDHYQPQHNIHDIGMFSFLPNLI